MIGTSALSSWPLGFEINSVASSTIHIRDYSVSDIEIFVIKLGKIKGKG